MTKRLVRIGLWRSDSEPHLPDPRALIDETWDQEQRLDVIDYLRRGFVSAGYMGFHRCRLCGVPAGSLELSDGTYVWPEGLVHYVEAHSVRLPAEVVEHIQRARRELEDAEMDDSMWLRLTR